MTSEFSGRLDANGHPIPPVLASSPYGRSPEWEDDTFELSSQMKAELLDTTSWGEILASFGRTMRAGVALTDTDGRILGSCHNAQPVWKLIHDNTPIWSATCPFCITSTMPCTAVTVALETRKVVMVRDQAGLTHIAVPLALGKQPLGAIVAGQVFDRYPESITLQRVARCLGVPAQSLWDTARKQIPVSKAILQTSGELLAVLGRAFLRHRYATILEAKLAETNARFRLLVEGVRDHALFTVDPAGDVTSWNRGAARLLGLAENRIVGRNFSCIFNPQDTQNHLPEKLLHDAFQSGQAEGETWHDAGEGQRFWANVTVTKLSQDAGPAGGFAILIQDVTARRNIETLLKEAHQERERLRERFISHVSHELRTPLTAIYLFTTNLLDGLLGDLTADQSEHLTLALDNIEQLKGMVDDLLDITRIDTHALAMEPQHLSPIKIVAEALNTCLPSATVKNISLRSEVGFNLPFLWADASRVQQILTNLIDNGIKFTPEGGTVSVGVQVYAEDEHFLRLWVFDTGCGISPENGSLVFERLAQVTTREEPSRNGLGLGLFIARELVSLHGGRIWVESQPERGSTFYFTLPVFSLAKLCAHIFTERNLDSCCVTLVTVDVILAEEHVQADILPELREVLRGCIHRGEDLLLPPMSDEDPVTTLFIVSCADANASVVIAGRIVRDLRNFGNVWRVQPTVAATTLVLARQKTREEQIGEVTTKLETLIRTHIKGKERLHERQDHSDRR
jgi:PAS domain S-box-containing protein